MKRATLTLLAAIGTAVALGPGPAGAGESSNDTIVTSEPLPGGGYVLRVIAARFNNNELALGRELGFLRLSDTQGMADDSPKCTQESPTEVRCKLQGLRRVAINTGDGNDFVRAAAFEMPILRDWIALSIRLGPGGDEATVSAPSDAHSPRITLLTGRGADAAAVSGPTRVRGGRNGDTLRGRRGDQRLFGGRGSDRITGGRGSNDHCDGQAGIDSGGEGCEKIVRIP